MSIKLELAKELVREITEYGYTDDGRARAWCCNILIPQDQFDMYFRPAFHWEEMDFYFEDGGSTKWTVDITRFANIIACTDNYFKPELKRRYKERKKALEKAHVISL